MILLAACTGEGGSDVDSGAPDGPEAELADMNAWVEASSADPFADAPADGTCPLGGTFVEGNTFEADTGVCTYLWTEQPLLADLRRGDEIELVFWHSALVADPPAEGHLALAVGGRALFEQRVAIPSDAAAYTEQATVAFDADAGDLLGLHLHNHGANTWNLLRITRLAR